jgi:hypothetical protein
MESSSYDRNAIGIENSLGELPEVYKIELINKLFRLYIDLSSSSTFRSSIEFCAPYLWEYLTKQTQQQVARLVDIEIGKGNAQQIEYAFQFLEMVGGQGFLSLTARKYKVQPLIEQWEENQDNWTIENECVKMLSRYADVIPTELLYRYVNCLTQIYVGYTGSSSRFSRTDFYADGASIDLFDNPVGCLTVFAVFQAKALQNRVF